MSAALRGPVGLTPVTDDPETGGFFAAAREHRLVVQTCRSCGHQQQPPRPVCRACLGTDLGWDDLPLVGTVQTWTVVEHQINPHFPVPYTTALVDVEPRPGEPPVRFLAHLEGRPHLEIGMAMRVTFVGLDDDVVIPNWEPAAEPPATPAP